MSVDRPLRLGALLTILLATLAVLVVADALYARHIRAGITPNPRPPRRFAKSGEPRPAVIHGLPMAPRSMRSTAEAGFAIARLRLPGSGVRHRHEESLAGGRR